jgi:outer membrane lipoprotein SlyB
MAGGHGGRTAVAQVSDQEQRLSPYRRSLFEARSSRIVDLRVANHVTRGNRCFRRTPTRTTTPRQATKVRTLRLAIYLLSLVMLGLAGCAPANPPKPAVQPASVAMGTILSTRAVNSHAGSDSVRAALLAGGSAPGDGDRSLVEFIVRADDGATLSIVQSNESGLRNGDRVTILRDDRTRLARPG